MKLRQQHSVSNTHAINHLRKEKGLTEKSNKPKGGQSEIRTRGRLPFNGFQDRLFRPLRHLSNVQCTKRQYSTAFGNLQHRTHINSVVRDNLDSSIQKRRKRGFPAKIRSETPNRESKNDASTTLTPFYLNRMPNSAMPEIRPPTWSVR